MTPVRAHQVGDVKTSRAKLAIVLLVGVLGGYVLASSLPPAEGGFSTIYGTPRPATPEQVCMAYHVGGAIFVIGPEDGRNETGPFAGCDQVVWTER